MRLLDQVAQEREPCIVIDGRGRHRMPGVADRAEAVAECPIRYVLQPNVVSRCRDLLRTDRAMFDRRNGLLRSSAPSLWLEWVEADGGRVGLLATADEAGRAGTVEVVWGQREGGPVLGQAVLRFDFEGTPAPPEDGSVAFAVPSAAHPMADHIIFTISRVWADHLFACGEAPGWDAVERVCISVLRDAEMLFAFTALLLHRPEIALVQSDLERINRQREKRNKAALLDHLEASLSLDPSRFGSVGQGMWHRSSRLHVVRGHMVHRGDAMFWRRSHLRGDLTRPIQSRTVSVS